MAWPHLEELTFETTKFTNGQDPQTTLRGLIWLAIYRRKLTALSFNFNETEESGNKAFLSQEHSAKAGDRGLLFLAAGHSFIELDNEIFTFVFPKHCNFIRSDTDQAMARGADIYPGVSKVGV